MKRIIFFLSMLYLSILVGMEKEKEQVETTIVEYTHIPDPFDSEVKQALAKLNPIPNAQQVRPHLVDIFPLADTKSHLEKIFGKTSVINQIPLPTDNQKIEFDYHAVDAVISLAYLHVLRNKYKEELFHNIYKNLIENGQVLLCLPAKLNKCHPFNAAFNTLKRNPMYTPYLSSYRLKHLYRYLTSEKVEEYLKKAGLTKLEITPYTRTIIFQNKDFIGWISSWMSSKLTNMAEDRKKILIETFATLYLRENPANLDKRIVCNFPYLLVHAEKK